jgi:hypothetical protein
MTSLIFKIKFDYHIIQPTYFYNPVSCFLSLLWGAIYWSL